MPVHKPRRRSETTPSAQAPPAAGPPKPGQPDASANASGRPPLMSPGHQCIGPSLQSAGPRRACRARIIGERCDDAKLIAAGRPFRAEKILVMTQRALGESVGRNVTSLRTERGMDVTAEHGRGSAPSEASGAPGTLTETEHLAVSASLRKNWAASRFRQRPRSTPSNLDTCSAASFGTPFGSSETITSGNSWVGIKGDIIEAPQI